MAKARILGHSYADDVTLTVTSAAAGYPVTNLQDRALGRKWRSIGLATQHITMDLGASKVLTGVALGGLNTTAAAEFSVKVSEAADYDPPTYFAVFSMFASNMASKLAEHWFDDAGGGFLVDGGGDFLVDGGGDKLVEGTWSLPATGRYVDISIHDPANPDGYIEGGRLKLSAYFDPSSLSHNIEPDQVLRLHERATLFETRGGGFRSNGKTPAHELDIRFGWIHEDDSFGIDVTRSVAELLETCGGGRDDIVVALHPGDGDARERRTTFIGVILDNTGIQTHFIEDEGGTQVQWSSLGMVLREAL